MHVDLKGWAACVLSLAVLNGCSDGMGPGVPEPGPVASGVDELLVVSQGVPYLVREDGTLVRTYSNLPQVLFEPRWSSDGQAFAFSAPSASGGHRLVLAASDESESKVLLDGWRGIVPFAFTGSRRSGTIVFWAQAPDGRTALWRIKADGTDLSALGDTETITTPLGTSPDGARLTWHTASISAEKSGLWMGNLNGTAARKILPPGGVALFIPTAAEADAFGTWSPDSKSYVFVTQTAWEEYEIGSSPAGSRDMLYRASWDGGTPTMLTSVSGRARSPAFSPDGAQIAFGTVGSFGAAGSVYVMASDGAGVSKVSESWLGSIEWSPDGEQLAFYTAGEVMVTQIDGSGQRVVRSGPATHLRWRPRSR